MDHKSKINFASENLAIPEVTVKEDSPTEKEDSNKVNMNPSVDTPDGSSVESYDDSSEDILYENIAFPEIHIKGHQNKQ